MKDKRVPVTPVFYRGASAALCVVALNGCTGMAETGPATDVPGHPESTKTNVLEAGASALQTDAPTDQLNIYLVGFHPMKDVARTQCGMRIDGKAIKMDVSTG